MRRSGYWVALGLILAIPAQAAGFDIVDLPDKGGKALLLSGTIEDGDYPRFHAAAATLPGHVVLTTGPGGNVLAALNIGSEIRGRGWTTLVPPGASCASACALAWLAGAARQLGDGARIGFHALALRQNGTLAESHQADMDLRHWLNQLGYSYDTANTIVNTPSASVRWLDPQELRANGIAVDPYP